MAKSHHSPNEIRSFPRKRYEERKSWTNGIKLASGCIDCGIAGPAEVLSFDHIVGDKKFAIGPSWNRGRAAIEKEIAKCEVVCLNCHAIRTLRRIKERNCK